jgi:hypothetical protein
MRRTPVLLALLVLLGILLGGLWWGVQGGLGTIRAAAGEQGQDSDGPGSALLLADQSAPAERSELAPIQGTSADELAVEPERTRPPGTLLFGTVLDAQGAPIAEAEVLAITASQWLALPLELDLLARPQEWSKLQRVHTDEKGRYELHALSGRQLRVMARKPGHVRAYLPTRMLPKSFDQMELELLRLPSAQEQRGTVLDTSGAPIVGAKILRAVEGLHPEESMPMEGAAVLVATTSAGGEFTLREEAGGLFALWAQAEGFLPQRLSGDGWPREGLSFRLERGSAVPGLVVELAGGVLPPGAQVMAWPSARKSDSANAEEEGSWVQSLQDALCFPVGENRQFLLEGIDQALSYQLELRAKDSKGEWRVVRGSSRVELEPGQRQTRIEISEPLETVGGVVDERTGLPITSYMVWAGTKDREGSFLLTENSEGRYCFADLRPSRNRPLRIRVQAPGYLEATSPEFLPLAKGRTEVAPIRMKPAPRLRVRVLAAENDAPLSDARVMVGSASNLPSSIASEESWERQTLAGTNFARTDAEGLAWLTVSASAPFHVAASARERVPSEPLACAALPLGEEREVVLKLAKGGRVRVEVRDSSGRPMQGVGILRRVPQTSVDTNDWLQLSPERESDANGVALFYALKAGTHLFRAHDGRGDAWVSNSSDAAVRDWVTVHVAEQGETLVQLRVPQRIELVGTVRAARRAVVGARVSLLRVTPEGQREESTWVAAFHAQTDPKGNYRFAQVAEGSYRLMVLHPSRALAQMQVVVLRRSEERIDIDLESCGLFGRVVDTQGAPIQGVYVHLNCLDELYSDVDDSARSLRFSRGQVSEISRDLTRDSVRTDREGRFELSGFGSGLPLMLNTYHDEYEVRQFRLADFAPDEERTGIELQLARAGRIHVTLIRPQPASGELEWLLVRFSRQLEGGASDLRAQEWAQGTCRAEQLGPGRYLLSVCNQEGLPLPGIEPVEAVLEEGGETRVSITLP